MNPRPPPKTPPTTRLAASACSMRFIGSSSSLLLMLMGCGTRVVTVPTTQPRQLAEPVQAYVYVQTQDGKRVKSTNRVQLYEGEWVLSDPGTK